MFILTYPPARFSLARIGSNRFRPCDQLIFGRRLFKTELECMLQEK